MRSADELAQPLMRAVDQLASMGPLGRAIKRAALATEEDPADPDMAALPALWLATIERATGLCVRHAESCAPTPDRERMGDAMRALIELATRNRHHSNFDAVERWALIEED